MSSRKRAKESRRNGSASGQTDALPIRETFDSLLESIPRGISLKQAREELSVVREKAGPDTVLSDKPASFEAVCGLEFTDPVELKGAPGVPAAVLVDEDKGLVFVSGAAGEGLSCLDTTDGRRLWHIGGDRLERVTGMALHEGTLYVCDSWKGRLAALSADDGSGLWNTSEPAPGRKLIEPWDVTVVKGENGPGLWVSDRGTHCIFRLDKDGKLEGIIGRRGMLIEEIIERYTADEPDRQKPFMEFPESITTGTDIDGKSKIFLWDSMNRRVRCFLPDGTPDRDIILECPETPAGRFAGQLTVFFDRAGAPLLLEVDDRDNSLLVWSHEGDLLGVYLLDEYLFGTGRRRERFRLACSGKTCMVTSRSKFTALDGAPLRSPAMLESLVALFPERSDLALSMIEAGRDGNPKPPGIDPAALAEKILREEGLLERVFARGLERLELYAKQMDSQEMEKLEAAVASRLEELYSSLLENLHGMADPGGERQECWTEALTELDMALFQNRGKNSSEEIALDATMEEFRNYPDRIRKLSWKLREVFGMLAGRVSAAREEELLSDLAQRAADLLERRALLLEEMDSGVSFQVEPQRVLREEMAVLHGGLIRLRALEKVSEGYSVLISRRRDKHEKPDSLLRRCIMLGSGIEAWNRLAAETGAGDVSPAPGELPGIFASGPDPKALEELGSLVSGMDEYLAKLGASSAGGGKFARVVDRQKEIFTVKASLVSNRLGTNGSSPGGAEELMRRVREFSGGYWNEYTDLRPLADGGSKAQ